jgi:2-keto-4-pentenoate hydratase/2-oxohepta-3-ene-1,7-dioic acid hydratase in catechol pathway
MFAASDGCIVQQANPPAAIGDQHMVVISRHLISQVAASAAALVVAAMPATNLVSARDVQPGTHATQPSTSITTIQGGQRAAVAPAGQSPAGARHDVDPDVMHHWYP